MPGVWQTIEGARTKESDNLKVGPHFPGNSEIQPLPLHTKDALKEPGTPPPCHISSFGSPVPIPHVCSLRNHRTRHPDGLKRRPPAICSIAPAETPPPSSSCRQAANFVLSAERQTLLILMAPKASSPAPGPADSESLGPDCQRRSRGMALVWCPVPGLGAAKTPKTPGKLTAFSREMPTNTHILPRLAALFPGHQLCPGLINWMRAPHGCLLF